MAVQVFEHMYARQFRSVLAAMPISTAFSTPFSDTPRLQGIFPATGFYSRALAGKFEQIFHTTRSRQAVQVASSIQEARWKLG